MTDGCRYTHTHTPAACRHASVSSHPGCQSRTRSCSCALSSSSLSPVAMKPSLCERVHLSARVCVKEKKRKHGRVCECQSGCARVGKTCCTHVRTFIDTYTSVHPHRPFTSLTYAQTHIYARPHTPTHTSTHTHFRCPHRDRAARRQASPSLGIASLPPLRAHEGGQQRPGQMCVRVRVDECVH